MWRLGIDLGGTKTVVAVGDADGRVHARVRFATEPAGDPERDLARIFARSRALLAELARDIETLLERSDAGEEEPDGRLVGALRTATERFEESHPELTAVVGRIADALSRLGI